MTMLTDDRVNNIVLIETYTRDREPGWHDADKLALAREIQRFRVVKRRLMEWAEYLGQSQDWNGVGPYIAAELRDRMNELQHETVQEL